MLHDVATEEISSCATSCDISSQLPSVPRKLLTLVLSLSLSLERETVLPGEATSPVR